MRRPLRCLALLAILVMAVVASTTFAQTWADFATVSMTNPTTPKLTANRLCYTDGTDIACDGAAGLLITSGTFSITNISATNLTVGGVAITGSNSGDRIVSGSLLAMANSATGYISLTTGGTNWGYLSSGASYLPKLSTANVSTTSGIQVGTMSATCASGISGTIRYNTASNTMEYCNGSSWANLGPSATTPVSFHVNKGGVTQTLANTTWTKVTFGTKDFDTNNNFSSSTFTPTVPGKYLLQTSVQLDSLNNSSTGLVLAIYKNGSAIAQYTAWGNNTTINPVGTISTIVDSNGATDYFEVYAWQGSGGSLNLLGTATFNYFQGALLSPQGGGSGGSTSPGGNTTNIQYNSSGNFAGSDNLAWDNTNRNLQVSGSMQFGGTGSEACASAADYGKNRRNPNSGRMQVCLFR